MKLWLLKPVDGLPDDDSDKNPWKPWYDKAFGFVVRAETENEARVFADMDAGEENTESDYISKRHPWLDEQYSTCVELVPEGDTGVIIQDFNAA